MAVYNLETAASAGRRSARKATGFPAHSTAPRTDSRDEQMLEGFCHPLLLLNILVVAVSIFGGVPLTVDLWAPGIYNPKRQ